MYQFARVSLAALAVGLTGGVAFAQQSTEAYAYDALGRLVVVDTTGGQNDGETHSICYDGGGNRTLYQAAQNHSVHSCVNTGGGSFAPTPTPTIAISNSSATEGGVINFVVTLSTGAHSGVSVNFASANGSAGAADFTAVSGALTFSAGQSSKAISVSTKQDLLLEGSEIFYLNLSGAVGARIADPQGIGTIFDDDDDPMCGDFFC